MNNNEPGRKPRQEEYTMKFDATTATNRELDTEYREGSPATKYEALVEMTKRIHKHYITPDVVEIFRQYKLNGAGDQKK